MRTLMKITMMIEHHHRHVKRVLVLIKEERQHQTRLSLVKPEHLYLPEN